MTIAICLTPEEWSVIQSVRTRMQIAGSVLLVSPDVTKRLIELGGIHPSSPSPQVDFSGDFDNEMQFLAFTDCNGFINELQTTEQFKAALDDDFSKIPAELRAVAAAFKL